MARGRSEAGLAALTDTRSEASRIVWHPQFAWSVRELTRQLA